MGGKARWRKLQRVVGNLPQGPHAALDKHKQRRERAKTRDAKRWRLDNDAEEEEANTILIGKAKEKRKEEGKKEVEEVDAGPFEETKERRKEEEKKKLEEIDTETGGENKIIEEKENMNKFDPTLAWETKQSKREDEGEEVEESDDVESKYSMKITKVDERKEVEEAKTCSSGEGKENMSREAKEKRKDEENEGAKGNYEEGLYVVTIEASTEGENERNEWKERHIPTEETKDKGELKERSMEESVTRIRRDKEGEGEEKRKEHEADALDAGKPKKLKTGKESRNEEDIDKMMKDSKEREEETWKMSIKDSIVIETAQEEMEGVRTDQEELEVSDYTPCKKTVKNSNEERQKSWKGKSDSDEETVNPFQYQQKRGAEKAEKKSEMKSEKEEITKKVNKEEEEEDEKETENMNTYESERQFTEQDTISAVVENRAGVWTPSLTGWVFRPYGDTTLEEELRKAQEEEDKNGKKDQRHDNGQVAVKFFLSDDESDSDTAIFVDVSQPTLLEDQNLQPSVATCSSSLPGRESHSDETLETTSELLSQPSVETNQKDEDVELILTDAIEEENATETVDPFATVSSMDAVMSNYEGYSPPQYDLSFQFFQAETPSIFISADPPTESVHTSYVNTMPLSFNEINEGTAKESTRSTTSNEESARGSMVVLETGEEDTTKYNAYLEVEPELFSTPSASTPREESPCAMNSNIDTQDPHWSDQEELQDAQDERYNCDSEAETRFFSLYPEYYPSEREEKSRDTGTEVTAHGNPKFPCFSGSCDSGESDDEEAYVAAQESRVEDMVRRHKGKDSRNYHSPTRQRKSEQETQNIAESSDTHAEDKTGKSANSSLSSHAAGGSSVPLVFDSSSTFHPLETESTKHAYETRHDPGHQAETTGLPLLEEEKGGTEAGQDALELEGKLEVEQGKQTLVGKARQWIKGVTRMGGIRRDDLSHGRQTILEVTDDAYKKTENLEFLKATSTAEVSPIYGKELRVHYTPERSQEVCFSSAEYVQDNESDGDLRMCQGNQGDSSLQTSLKRNAWGLSHTEDQGKVPSAEDLGKHPTLEEDTTHYAKSSDGYMQYEDEDGKALKHSDRDEDSKKHNATDEETKNVAERQIDSENNTDSSSPSTKPTHREYDQKPDLQTIPLTVHIDNTPLSENTLYGSASAQGGNDHLNLPQNMNEPAYNDYTDVHSIPTTKQVSFSFPEAPVFSAHPPLENLQDHLAKDAEHQKVQLTPAASSSFYEGAKLYYAPEKDLNSSYTPGEGLTTFCQSTEALQPRYIPEIKVRSHETLKEESVTDASATDSHKDDASDKEDFKLQDPSFRSTSESTTTHYTVIEEYIVSYSPAGEQCTYLTTEEERMKCMSMDEEKQCQSEHAEEQKARVRPQDDQMSYYVAEEKTETYSSPQTNNVTFENDKILFSSSTEQGNTTPEEDGKSETANVYEEFTQLTPKDETKEVYAPAQIQQCNPILAEEPNVYHMPEDEESINYEPAEESYTVTKTQKSHQTYEILTESDNTSLAHEGNSPSATVDPTYCDNQAEDKKTASTLDQSTPEWSQYTPVEGVKIQYTPGADLKIYYSPDSHREACLTADEELETTSLPSKNDGESKKEEDEISGEGRVEAAINMDDEGNNQNKKEMKNSCNRRKRKESEREGRRDSEREDNRESEEREMRDSSEEMGQPGEIEGWKGIFTERRNTGEEPRENTKTEEEFDFYDQGKKNSDGLERKDCEREEGLDDNREGNNDKIGRKDSEKEKNKEDEIKLEAENRKEGGRQERRSSDYEKNRENSRERNIRNEERRHSNFEGRRNNSGQEMKEEVEERRVEEEQTKHKSDEKAGGKELKTTEDHDMKRWNEMKGRPEEEDEGGENDGMKEKSQETWEEKNSEVEKAREMRRKEQEEMEGKEATGSLHDPNPLQVATTTSNLSNQHGEGNGSEGTQCSLPSCSLTSSDQITTKPNQASAPEESVSGTTESKGPLEMTTSEACEPQAEQIGSSKEAVMAGTEKRSREFKSRQKQNRTRQQHEGLTAVAKTGNATADGNNPHDLEKEGKSGSKRKRNRRNKGTDQRMQETVSHASSESKQLWTATKATGAESLWSVEDPLEGNTNKPSKVLSSRQQKEPSSPRQSLESSSSSAKLTVTVKNDSTAISKKQQERHKDSQKCARESRQRISRFSDEQKASGAGEYAVSGCFGASSGKEVHEVEKKGRRKKGKGSERNQRERDTISQEKLISGAPQEGVANQSKNCSPNVERKDKKENRKGKRETVKVVEVISPREGLGGMAQRGSSGSSQGRTPLLETPPMEPYSYITQKRYTKTSGYPSPGSLLEAEALPGPPRTTAKLKYPEALLQPLSPPPSPPPPRTHETKTKGKTRPSLHETESNKEIPTHSDSLSSLRKTSQSTMYTIPEAAPAKPEPELASDRPQCPPKPIHLKDTSGCPSSGPSRRKWPAHPQDKQQSDSSFSTSVSQPLSRPTQSFSPPQALTPLPSVSREVLEEQRKYPSRRSAPLLPTPQQQQQQKQQQHQKDHQQEESVDSYRDTPNTKSPLKPKPNLVELDPLHKTSVADTARDEDSPPENSKALGCEEAKPISSSCKVSVAERMKFPEALDVETDSDSSRTQPSQKPEVLDTRSTPSGKHTPASTEGITTVPSQPLNTAESSHSSLSRKAHDGSSSLTGDSEPNAHHEMEGPVQKVASSPKQQCQDMGKSSASEINRDASKPGGRYVDVATKGRHRGELQEPRTSPHSKGNRGTNSVGAYDGQTQERSPKAGMLPDPREAVKEIKKKKKRR